MKKMLVVFAVVMGACGGGSGVMFGDGGTLPPDCENRCPSGYTCDNGVCKGGDPSSLSFGLTTIPLSATLTVDGQAPMAGAGCSGDHVRVLFADGPLPKSFLDPVLGTLVTTFVLVPSFGSRALTMVFAAVTIACGLLMVVADRYLRGEEA